MIDLELDLMRECKESEQYKRLQNFADTMELTIGYCNHTKTKFCCLQHSTTIQSNLTYKEMNLFLLGIYKANHYKIKSSNSHII